MKTDIVFMMNAVRRKWFNGLISGAICAQNGMFDSCWTIREAINEDQIAFVYLGMQEVCLFLSVKKKKKKEKAPFTVAECKIKITLATA